jgi:DNA repair exonuclease SbcCD ATPase subunit
MANKDADALKALCSRNYKLQSIWFLNAFWHKLENEAENIWNYSAKMGSLDLQKGADGNEVDEMNMHRFLEFFKETQTVAEMRDSLRSTGAITGNIKNFPITLHYLFKYKVDWHQLVNASQGDNKKEIDEAQNKLDMVSKALKDSEDRAKEAKEALHNAQAKESESKTKESEAKAAQQELEAALKELKAQEDEFNNKTNTLKAKSEDEGSSVVARNKAKNELSQHLASDPLPLRKAKITQEAAVKKADRATQAASDALKAAIAAKEAATHAKEAAEAAVEETQKKFEEAEAYLREVKSKPGAAQGQIWWLERELHEKKKFLPERKGGIKK